MPQARSLTRGLAPNDANVWGSPWPSLLVASDNRRGTPLKIVREESIRGRVKMVWLSTAGPGGIRWARTGWQPQ